MRLSSRRSSANPPASLRFFSGTSFDKELQLFRRRLRAFVGSSDKDYQKLRAERTSRPDDDDDAAAPTPPAVPQPAAPGVNEPE